jgi:glutamate-1-semialdehyde 2,1-aminomutase
VTLVEDKNLNYQERARRVIPGITQLLSKRMDQFSMGVWPGYFDKATGAEVWDLNGQQYLDMSISGIGANILGYCDPEVDQAVHSAVNKGTSASLNCPEEVVLAETLCELHPWAENVRFARTGGESMAMAVRIARAASGRDKVAFCGYHGWHDWYLAANLRSDSALSDHLLPGLDPCGVPRALEGSAIPFRYNHIEDLERIVAQYRDQLGVIVMEPIRSESPKPGFLAKVRSIADEIGAVFVLDEISAGFRLTVGGAHLLLGINPDIAVFSKALGNGYPIAAIIGRQSIMDVAQKSFISSTYWTERIGPVAALAVIKKMREKDVCAWIRERGEDVQQIWRDASEDSALPVQVSGIPALSHFSFEDDDGSIKAYYVQLMLEEEILASNRFYPMYAHSAAHVDRYRSATHRAFAQISSAVVQGLLPSLLRGQPASSGFARIA